MYSGYTADAWGLYEEDASWYGETCEYADSGAAQMQECWYGPQCRKRASGTCPFWHAEDDVEVLEDEEDPLVPRLPAATARPHRWNILVVNPMTDLGPEPAELRAPSVCLSAKAGRSEEMSSISVSASESRSRSRSQKKLRRRHSESSMARTTTTLAAPTAAQLSMIATTKSPAASSAAQADAAARAMQLQHAVTPARCSGDREGAAQLLARTKTTVAKTVDLTSFLSEQRSMAGWQ